jgi:hypothetical protein
MTMAATTQATTANQLIELKFISASVEKMEWYKPIFGFYNTNICSTIRFTGRIFIKPSLLLCMAGGLVYAFNILLFFFCYIAKLIDLDMGAKKRTGFS